MDVLFKNFLATYSLPTVFIALAVGIFSFLCRKTAFDKINPTVKNYFCFFLTIILYFAYDMIFVSKAFIFKDDALYAGILSGSLAKIISATLKRISDGKPSSLTAVKLLIEELICEIADENLLSATALSIEKLFAKETDNKILKEQIVNILASNAVKPFTLYEYESTALLIIQAVKSIKQNCKL